MVSPEGLSAELCAGSSEPSDPEAVERLLRMVPEVAFCPELAALVPDRAGAKGLSQADVRAHADEQWRGRLAEALRALEKRAARDNAGGLAFLARTFAHFLDDQPIDPDAHPLVVALFLRAEAKAGRIPDSPLGIGRALDRWDAATADAGQSSP